jgi:hypothetical protein
MAKFDIKSKMILQTALAAAIASSTTTNGSILDTANYDLGLTFALSCVAFTDGVYTLQVWTSDDSGMSGEVQLTGDNLIGTAPAVSALSAAGGTLGVVGVIGNKRYVRVKIVSTGVTSGATVRVLAIQSAEHQPV